MNLLISLNNRGQWLFQQQFSYKGEIQHYFTVEYAVSIFVVFIVRNCQGIWHTINQYNIYVVVFINCSLLFKIFWANLNLYRESLVLHFLFLQNMCHCIIFLNKLGNILWSFSCYQGCTHQFTARSMLLIYLYEIVMRCRK